MRLMTLLVFFGWNCHEYYNWDDPRVDYSEYLGPEWRKELKEHMDKQELDSMVVCNHTGILDVLTFLTSDIIPAFTPSAQFRKIPVVGYVLISLQCAFADRAASLEARDSLIQTVIKR